MLNSLRHAAALRMLHVIPPIHRAFIATSAALLPRVKPIERFSAPIRESFNTLLALAQEFFHSIGEADHFLQALEWINQGKDLNLHDFTEIDHGAVLKAYAFIYHLINLSIAEHYPAKAVEIDVPEAPIGIIATRHPCVLNHQYDPILAQLRNWLKHPEKTKGRELMQALWEIDAKIPAATLNSEILINHELISRLIHATVKLEMKHDAKPGSLVEFHNWTGTEADRNATTSRIILLTKILDIQQALRLYQQKVEALLADPKHDAIKANLKEFEKILKTIQAHLKPAWRIAKTLAAIDIKRFGKDQKFVKDNIQQLFAGKAEEVEPFYRDSAARFHLAEDPLKAQEQLEAFLTEALMQAMRCFPQLEQALSIAELIAPSPAIKELRHLLELMGLHFTQAQGRLDCKEVIPEAYAAVAARADKDKPLTLAALSTLPAEVQETVSHFRSILLLNKINPKNIPRLVLANFSGKDFISAFNLAREVGLIEIKDGKVVKAHIILVPLLESVHDHYKAAEYFEELLKDPVICSYYQHLKEFCIMSAYSDTPREDGFPAARFAIAIAGQQVYAVFKKYFDEREVVFRRQHGNGSSPLRSGDLGVDLEMARTMPRMDLIGHRRTWQPGRLDWAGSSEENALEAMMHALQAPKIQEAFTADFIEFMQNFVAPGMLAFKDLACDPKGEFNQLLLMLRETWEVLNHRRLGSRGKPIRDSLDESVIFGERMITVTQLFMVLGFEIHAFYPFAISMQNYCGYPVADASKLAKLQHYYETHLFFRQWLQKLEELIFLSASDALIHYRMYNPALADKLINTLEIATQSILTITKQPSLLAARTPEVRAHFELCKEVRNQQRKINWQLFILDDPRPNPEKPLELRRAHPHPLFREMHTDTRSEVGKKSFIAAPLARVMIAKAAIGQGTAYHHTLAREAPELK